MTTGHTRASSAGMVADAIATFLDDGFRLRSDAVSARRRLVASLCAVATPLIDGGGRQVTRLVGLAGEALWRGAQKAEQVGGQVADEAADAGREGARAVRDAAVSRQGVSSGRGSSPQDREGTEGTEGTARSGEEFVDVADMLDVVDFVEVIDVVEPDVFGAGLSDPAPVGGVPDEGLAAAGPVDEVDLSDEVDLTDDADLDEVEVDELDLDEEDVDDDLLDEGLPAEEVVPDPAPAVLSAAAEIGGDRGQVDEVDEIEVVSEEAVVQITGDAAPERRTPRRSSSTTPRPSARPARRDRPREERRATASNGSRDRRS